MKYVKKKHLKDASKTIPVNGSLTISKNPIYRWMWQELIWCHLYLALLDNKKCFLLKNPSSETILTFEAGLKLLLYNADNESLRSL